MINIKNLQFGYDRGDSLFNDLNLQLEGGQIHGLLGLNGAGKSSLLHILQGLRHIRSGKVQVFDHEPHRRKSSFLQKSFLIPEEVFTPATDLQSYVNKYSLFYPKFSLQDFLQFLNEFEIERKSHFGKMSMGQKKKVIIAFGLATNTNVLLMDEPTNGLDIPSKKQFRKILSHILTENRLFIISTHQIRDLHSLIDNVIIIKEGKIIFNNTIENICQNLLFTLEKEPSKDKTKIYHERVPGGYLNILPHNGQESFEPDLEVLFNAIVTDGDLFVDSFS